MFAIQCVVIYHNETHWTWVKGEGVDSLSEEAELFAAFTTICNMCVLVCEVYEAVTRHMKSAMTSHLVLLQFNGTRILLPC